MPVTAPPAETLIREMSMEESEGHYLFCGLFRYLRTKHLLIQIHALGRDRRKLR
jgi:hypothetical protein